MNTMNEPGQAPPMRFTLQNPAAFNTSFKTSTTFSSDNSRYTTPIYNTQQQDFYRNPISSTPITTYPIGSSPGGPTNSKSKRTKDSDLLTK